MIGETIRRLRRSKKLTLQKVGAATGLSPGFLSQVEHGQAMPSLTSLRKIAEALNTSLFRLLASEVPTSFVVRRDQRKSCNWPGRHVVFELLTPDVCNSQFEVVLTCLRVGQTTCDEPLSHGRSDDQEFAVILGGRVELTVGEDLHILDEGDSVLFSSALPHRYRGLGDVEARILSIVYPPSF
jgi:transcriptional regulator with XRE-family HTH domain